MNSPKGRNISQ